MLSNAIDIGHGVFIQYVSWNGVDKVGLIEDHKRRDNGDQCFGGSVMFDVPAVRDQLQEQSMWTVESWEPLTLSPSLLCTVCGHHGWIRDGRWVPA